jgi:hypothetical protein
MHDAVTDAEKVVRDIGGRMIASTAYTTAWAARMTTPDGQEVFPRARHWLTRHQHRDGSWGSDAVHNPYDRLVSTLAAITALAEAPDDTSQRAVHAGVDFLQHRAADWRGAPGETVGFEVAAPFLLEQARRHGLDVSVHGAGELHRLRADKLAAVVDSGALLREPTSLLYSVEALTDLVPARKRPVSACPTVPLPTVPPPPSPCDRPPAIRRPCGICAAPPAPPTTAACQRCTASMSWNRPGSSTCSPARASGPLPPQPTSRAWKPWLNAHQRDWP